MTGFHFNEKYISQSPALQVLIKSTGKTGSLSLVKTRPYAEIVDWSMAGKNK